MTKLAFFYYHYVPTNQIFLGYMRTLQKLRAKKRKHR